MNHNHGLKQHIPAEQYHAMPGVSNSMLSAMKRSPAHCHAIYLDPKRPAQKESTPAMKAGTLAHSSILEPHLTLDRYYLKPDGLNFATKEGKAWREEIPQGREIVTRDDMEAAEAQRNAILRVPVLANLLETGKPELSVFWQDATSGLECRSRPDWLHITGPTRVIALDIKTIADLSPEAVSKSIANYGYHRQAAHYTNGLIACGLVVEAFVFGFVSGSYPYLAAAFILDDEALQQGQDEVAELLDLYAQCKRHNFWPAFGDTYQLIGLPTWARRSAEVEVSYV